ncbi:OmpH family outer membrane protein [Glycocaulis profundi]|nr:OmpH family outer membrane protein [Glycocaulis profundi]
MFNQIIRACGRQIRGLFAAAVMAGGLAGAAAAQDVLVMNEERILRDSQVGQHVAAQMEVIGNEIQQELDAASGPLEAENERLSQETAALSQEAIQQRPDLIQQIQQLQQQAQEFEQLRRIRSQELMATQRQAMQPVLETLQTVLQEVVNERNASVLLDRSQVVYARDTVDVSQAVIERLDQRIQTTPVNRVRAPQNGQQ